MDARLQRMPVCAWLALVPQKSSAGDEAQLFVNDEQLALTCKDEGSNGTCIKVK
jgi:hypothetical protein